MSLISPDNKLADAIHSNYLLIPVVTRFGIRLGFGEKTVREVCAESGVDEDFFTTILNVFSQESYFPQERLLRFDVLQLVEYLRRTHDYYRDVLLPILERLLEELRLHSPQANRHEMSLIENFFAQFKVELTDHLQREEDITFPYVEALMSGENMALLRRKYAITTCGDEHSNLDTKLNDLKNILVKYLQGDYHEGARNMLIFNLFRLEKDLQDHTRIEDKILVPMITRIEQSRYTRLAERLDALLPEANKGEDADEKSELSAREREVLVLVARGMMNKEIADSLNISMHTVITHRKNITAKLGIKTIPGLTVYAILNGIITDAS
jgi:regulator of cell morphogenesis and NO signaling